MSLSSTAVEATRWRAVQQRDKSFHSTFIYAVLTTRIFCRPTCPARLARRANVVFFDSAVDAASAGFRPCKRCKPAQQDIDSDIHRMARTVSLACELIKAREGNVSVSEVVEHVGFSVRHLYGMFKRVVGCSPAAYASRVREEHQKTEAKSQLRMTEAHDEDEIQVNRDVDYSCPSTYAGTETWMWDNEDELIALTESCGSVDSPDLLTPISAGSPSSEDWMFFTQFEACGPDTSTVTLQKKDLLYCDSYRILARE